MERWNGGKMEKWKDGKMEKWKDGKMERWKDGKMEIRPVGGKGTPLTPLRLSRIYDFGKGGKKREGERDGGTEGERDGGTIRLRRRQGNKETK